MLDDTATQLARLRSLLERADAIDGLGEVDDALTDGYALALALEAEQRKLDDHIRALAGLQGRDDDELVSLSERRSARSRELEELRRTLGRVRERRTAIRIELMRPVPRGV